MDSGIREANYPSRIWIPLWTMLSLSAANLENTQNGPIFSNSYRGVGWTFATTRCQRLGKRLCMKKDLCREAVNKRWTPRSSISVPKRNTWIPIADEYNEWMYLGPQTLQRCQKLTKTEGPPFWAPRACQINFITPNEPEKKRAFCGTHKGYYCCAETAKHNGANPRPKPIYIFSRNDKIGPHYLFSLDRYLRERTWKNDQAPWKKAGELEGDVSKITLMSGYVKDAFENPVYFCYRTFRNSDRLLTTLHKVSKTWCDGHWTLNFYLYGNYSSDANDTKFQRLIIGNSPSQIKHSRISLKEGAEFPASFSIYGPSDPSNPDAFIQRVRIAGSDACNGEAEILTTKTGIISSPNFPSKYNAKGVGNMNCTWKIIGPVGAILKLSFKSMKLSNKRKRVSPLVFRKYQGRKVAKYAFYSACPFDRVDIKGYGRFCGNELPPKFFTVGNEVTINLFGRRGSKGTNFALYYEMIEPRHHREEIIASHNESFSWISANQTCFQRGKNLCKARNICISNSRPFYGVKYGDQWAPVEDEYNDWIQIGRGNIDTCRRHNAVLGPPQWGIDVTVCVKSNVSQPCPVRKYVYCCHYVTSPAVTTIALPLHNTITVDVYSIVQNGIPFYKYVRKGVDNPRSFDSLRQWKIQRRTFGGITSFTMQKEWSPTFNNVVYFCSSTVIPSIGIIKKAFALSLSPCEENGWQYLYHLYSIGLPTASSVKLFVGVSSSRPSHTQVNGVAFARGFRLAGGFILYTFESSMKDEPSKDNVPSGNGEMCDGYSTVIEAPTVLQSPGYPKSYPRDVLCRWHVKMPKESRERGGHLKLTIEELNLEDPVDILNVQEIRSTNETTDVRERNQSSVSKSGRDFTGIVTQTSMTTHQSFLLTFSSDSSISGKGFRIRFDVLREGCGGTIKHNGKTITPDNEYNDKENSSCFWSINAPQNHSIELKFVTFDLSAGGNCSERIYVTFDKQQRLFCEDTIPPRRIVTDSNVANVTYFSLKSVSSEPSKIGEKFYIEVIFVEKDDARAPRRPHNIQCGVQSVPFTSSNPVSEKIVNGKIAANGNFPWLVMIGRPGITCGGTLISNRMVLSATHCFVSIYSLALGVMTLHTQLSNFVIIAGRYQRNIPSPREQTFNITSLFVHGGYQRYAARWTNRIGLEYFGVFPYNDLAIAKLDREAEFTFTVSPACLPTQDAHVGDFCYVAGWGSVSTTRLVMPKAMNYARVPILDSSICGAWEEMKGTVMENSLCAGFVRGGGDHCWGDSGGSLVCKGKFGNFYVNGIVSWSRECAGTRTPGMYTRVWKFVDWILGVIN